MKQDRRNFLKGAGAVGLVATTGALTVTHAETRTATSQARGMAKGLTLLTMRRNGDYALGVKTERGILNVQQASKQLRMPAPATMDDLLQHEQGPALMALVSAALKPGAKTTFLKEDTIEYGPVVTRPEKIVCIGLNYRRHAKEVGMEPPSQPVLFNKYNNALNHHNGTIKLPSAVAKKFDYEVELVMIIKRRTSARRTHCRMSPATLRVTILPPPTFNLRLPASSG